MVKGTETIRRQQPTNYLSKFEHFVVRALKGLIQNPRKHLLVQGQQRKHQKVTEICLRITIKMPEQRHGHRSGVFIVNFELTSFWCLYC